MENKRHNMPLDYRLNYLVPGFSNLVEDCHPNNSLRCHLQNMKNACEELRRRTAKFKWTDGYFSWTLKGFYSIRQKRKFIYLDYSSAQ